VHLAVVDPGVGTERRPLVLATGRGDRLVGPDNGLLVPGADALGGLVDAWILEPHRVRKRAGLPQTGVSHTFHGRDVFAPAAALLALGVPASEIGCPFDVTSLEQPREPFLEATTRSLIAEVIEIDRFGNAGLAARFDHCVFPTASVRVEVVGEDLPMWNARVVDTFGQLLPGELGVYRDSWGQVALALNGASAAQLLSLNAGMIVRIELEETA
jgi:S-adenosylmethionine hydrolase